MIDKYLENKYKRPISEIRCNASFLKDILLNEHISRAINVFNSEAWSDENIRLFIRKLKQSIINGEKIYPLLDECLKSNTLVCELYMKLASNQTFYNFNREAFNETNYTILKDNIRKGISKLPDCFKKDSKTLLDFINDLLDVGEFEKEAWDDFAVDLYLKRILVFYKLSKKAFKIPKGLYDNHKVFIFLLEKRLLTLDPSYSYSLELSLDDIEKYVKFLKENRVYIKNQDNFIKSPLLLKKILEEGLVNYIYSFKDEAWSLENISLFLGLLKREDVKLPKPLISNPLVLNTCIISGRNVDDFGYGAWNEDNIKLFISVYGTEKIPNELYYSELYLSYYLSSDDSSKLCYFKDEAWSLRNIELFEKRLIKNPILPSEFPLAFMFNPDILYFLLNNDLYEYLDLFLNKSWSSENINLFKILLKDDYIDYIPRALRDNASVLSFCLENNLMDYPIYFDKNAWNVYNSKMYVMHFDNDNFLINENMRKSKDFAITLIMFGYYEKLLDFPVSSTPDEYVDILFESIILDRDKCETVSSKYKEIKDDNMKTNFRNYVIRNRQNIKNIDDIVYIFQNINYSNSSEIKKIGSQISDLVLSCDEPRKEFNKIERVFLSDDLPNIAKVYCIFRMFHTDSSGNLWLNVYDNISPVLKRYSSIDLKRHSLMCEVIIFEDLLKSYIESNNMEFKRYLRELKLGDELFNRVVLGDNNLSYEENNLLKSYLRKLSALYNQTLAGKKNNYVLIGNIEKDVKNLKALFKNSDSSQKLIDRIVQMYTYYIGIHTYDSLIEHIKNKVDLSDKRGRKYEKTTFMLEKGDFIKGVGDVKYLPNILNNGSLSTEFLGSSATEAGDTTPLDTDGSMIRKDGSIKDTFSDGYSAFSYGDTWIVVKKDKLYVTRDENGEVERPCYDKDKLEVFYTGAISYDQYGIRTGFSSTDIDCIITRQYTNNMGFEIARSGFYIPVYDTSGNIVFTSEMYDEIRKQMNGLSYYGVDKFEFSDNLSFPDIEYELDDLNKVADETLIMKQLIMKVIGDALREFNLYGNDKLDGDLSRNIYNFIDIGSSGRGTQTIGADFDFMLMLDQCIIQDEEKMEKIVRAIRLALNDDLSIELNSKNDIRLKKVYLGGKYIDIDISFEGKTDRISYSSDMALKDKIETMEKTSKEKSVLVKANITKAKKILKKFSAYKSIASSEMEGGLGGAGVENWILSNGGSLIDASISFLKAYDKAYELSDNKSADSIFFEFLNIYNLWNFGENFFALRTIDDSLHNEFVSGNMSSEGLEKMANALKNYLKEIDISYKEEKVLENN